jgi:hypothetical protein
MSIAQVQKVQNTTTTGTTATVTIASATANNLLVIAVASNDPSYTLPSGFSSAVLNFNATEGDILEIIYKVAAGGETALTTTNWAGNTRHLGAWEYSGVDTSTPLDKTATTTRTVSVTSLASGSTGTLSQADEVAIAAWACRADVTGESIDSSFTVENLGNGGFSAINGTLIVSATTALNATASWTTSATAWSAIATFKAAAGGSPVTKFFASIIGAAKLIWDYMKFYKKKQRQDLVEIYG